MKREIIELVINKLRNQASKARLDAGYSGSWDDGGASALESNIDFYVSGLNQQVPSFWQSIYSSIETQYENDLALRSDPEYHEYLRLKQKFSK